MQPELPHACLYIEHICITDTCLHKASRARPLIAFQIIRKAHVPNLDEKAYLVTIVDPYTLKRQLGLAGSKISGLNRV